MFGQAAARNAIGAPASIVYSSREPWELAGRVRPRVAISYIERLCLKKGLKMTEQRRIIARVLSESTDHPDVEQLYRRAVEHDPRISLATVYRTVRLFEETNILERHDFGHGRARYERAPEKHHDHLIDIRSGEVLEFQNEEIERLQEQVARRMGYELVDHRLALYGVPLKDGTKKKVGGD